MAFRIFLLSRLLALSVILQHTTGTMQCDTLIGVGVCPDTWHQWGNNCYKATAKQQWLEAKQECIEMGGVMVVPQSDKQTDFLLSIESWFWIDCNKLQGSWECQEGTTEVQFRNWDPNGEPSDRPGEDCAEVWTPPESWGPYTAGKWNDISCAKQGAAMCKIPLPLQLHF